MKSYEAIIFDMDGTVLNTLEDLTESLNYVFRKHTLEEKTKLQVRSCLGYGYSGLISRTAPDASPELQQELQEDFIAYYSTHCQNHTKPYDGIPAMLKVLRDRGYKTAIVSNKGQAAVTELHDIFFSDLVRLSMGESQGYRKKPEPDMILHALDQLNCSRQNAVYIGDSEVDKQTADNSGLDSVLVTWGFRDKPFLEALHPNYLVSSPQELPKLFL